MGQGGNVWEWNESAYDDANNSASEDRASRGGGWFSSEFFLRSSGRDVVDPSYEFSYIGFRVASVPGGSAAVPEPGTWAAAALLAGGAAFVRWRKRAKVA
jgi:hypothetical protein